MHPWKPLAAHHTNSPGKAQLGLEQGESMGEQSMGTRIPGGPGGSRDVQVWMQILPQKPVHPVAVENQRLRAVQEGRSLAGHWSRQQHSCLLRDLSRLQTCPGTSLTNTAQFQFLALVLPRWLWDFFLGNQRSQEDNKCPSHTRLPCCSTTPTPH